MGIRASYIAHTRASAYVYHKPIKPMGLKKLRIDLCVKILPTGERFYPPGLMIHQRPYLVVTKDKFGDDRAFFTSIITLLDTMTSAVEMAEGSERSDEGSSSEEEEEGEEGEEGEDDGDFAMGGDDDDGGDGG